MTEKIIVENLVKTFGSRPKLALEGLKKGWNKKEILKKTGQTIGVNKVSFSVDEGEIFVIIGLSGSGKSTIIRCLNLLNKPTSGNVIVDGENIVNYDKNSLREFRQEKMAMVFQQFGLFTHMTVLENVAYGLEIKKVDKEKREKIAIDAIEEVGLKGWEHKMPNELSGGMQQRVGLARALANDPDILLMDEPFSALDPLIRRDMQIELLDLQSRLKKTIVFITHDINEAFKLGDRVAVMRDGSIVQMGTPEEILNNPSDEYIEDFVKDIDRTKVVRAKDIMKRPNAIVSLNAGVRVAIKEMQVNDISSVFVVDKNRKIQGIVTIDDCIESVKNNKSSLKEILKQDYYTTKEDVYIEDLIDKGVKTKYPIVVVDNEERVLGIIVRTSILTGLLTTNGD
ncbi:quaternary amine ABC transporter ATP-binding protein [Anaerosalibacter massiliensis]|uniref:Quaternary amine transport ATP-binding protein n=1 Tax=Anaerosalibacter massiliensis TaxID=1347392 RepID=A0A9X2S4J9_9FIRM|nr:glycine betaine/L-proline ABC transporter ATP-binding protein [Anaerosalibacter massiliensis]MCR2043558.1 glycine betaine/L-proline ABC transporter ATP-binding protein [Anaerosalibacter massiliensis]